MGSARWQKEDRFSKNPEPPVSAARHINLIPSPPLSTELTFRNTNTTISVAASFTAAIGGGGLMTNVGARSRRSTRIKVWGAELETAAPAALSFAMGSPQVFKDWKLSLMDGAGGQSLFPRMWERMKAVVDGYIVVAWTKRRRRCG